MTIEKVRCPSYTPYTSDRKIPQNDCLVLVGTLPGGRAICLISQYCHMLRRCSFTGNIVDGKIVPEISN